MKLIVKPILLSAAGSYKERRELRDLHRRLREISNLTPKEQMALMDEMEAVTLPRLSTDDGTPVEDAIDKLSAHQFDDLFFAIGYAGGDADPPASASS